MKENKKNDDLKKRALNAGFCFAVIMALAFSVFGLYLLYGLAIVLHVVSLGSRGRSEAYILLLTTPLGWALLITMISSALFVMCLVKNFIKGKLPLNSKKLSDKEEKTNSESASELSNRQLFDKFSIIAVCAFVICLLVYYLVF